MGNIRCMNCRNEISMISGTECPHCGAYFSHVRISFLCYLGSEDSISGFHSSNVLVFLRSLFKISAGSREVDSAKLYSEFTSYYKSRSDAGLMPDKGYNSYTEFSLSQDYEYSSAAALLQRRGVIRFEDIEHRETVLFQKSLEDFTEKEKQNIIDLCDRKLALYYRSIGSDTLTETPSRFHDEQNNSAKLIDSEIKCPSIADLGLSTRSFNGIMRSGIKTFDELKKAIDSGDIFKIRNLGKQSTDEIISAVQNVLNGTLVPSENKEELGLPDKSSIDYCFRENAFTLFRKYCHERGWSDISDLVGFDCNELIQERGFGASKINAVQRKIKELMAENDAAEEMVSGETAASSEESTAAASVKKTSIDELDNMSESNYVLSVAVLYYFGFRHFTDLLNADIHTLFELKNTPCGSLLKLLGSQDYPLLLSAAAQLSEPFSELVSVILDTFSADRVYNAFLLRANGDSLQVIADQLNLTRERVRQICEKAKRRLMPLADALKTWLFHNSGKDFFFEEQLSSILGDDDYCTVVKYLLRDDETVLCLDFANLFVLKDNYPEIEDDLMKISERIVGDGVNLFEKIDDIELELTGAGYSFLTADHFLDFLIDRGFEFYGDFVVRSKQSYAVLCASVVAEEFEDGIRFEDEDINKLRELTEKKYGKLSIPENNRSFMTRVSASLVQRDRSVYISPQNVYLDSDVLNQIKDFIDQSPLQELYYKEIYAEHEGLLLMTSNIDNAGFLHGVLCYYYPDEYEYTRDYLRKKESGTTLSLEDRVLQAVKEYGKPIRKDALLALFPGMAESVLLNIVLNSTRLIQWEYNYYYCVDNLNVSNEEVEIIDAIVKHIVDLHDGYCSEEMLWDESKEKLKDMLIHNGAGNSQNLFYIASAFLNNRYDFRRPHITKIGRFKSLNVQDIALDLLGYPEQLKMSDYFKLAEDLKWSNVTSGMVFSEIERNYVRISQDDYVERGLFILQPNDLMYFKSCMPEDTDHTWFISLQIFSYSDDELPNGYKVNEFLAASVFEAYPMGWHIVRPQTKDRRYEKGILVRDDKKIYDYDVLTASALKDAGISKLSESQLLSFLQIHQLSIKVIPKQLYLSPCFCVEDGEFTVI